MPRAIWTGVLQFVLISFPVKIYKATDDKGVSFKMFHSVCGNSIHQKKWCEVCGREVTEGEINKGYEIGKGQYVLFTEDEIENAQPENAKTIKIEKAVPADEIPIITYESSYFIAPDKGGEHVYNLLFNALSMKPKVLIGRVVQRSKEHLVAIRPYSDGLLLSMLHYSGEVRDIDEVVNLKSKEVDKNELELAITLLDTLTGSFGQIDQKDKYRDYIEDIAQKKAAGQIVTIEPKKPITPKVNVLDGLRKSIEMLTTTGGVENKAAKPAPMETIVIPPKGVKKELNELYGVTEQEIDNLIADQKIEDAEERLKVLKELKNFKSFEDYIKDHQKEFEGISVAPDFKSITINKDTYPRMNLTILKKIGIVAEHYGVLIYIYPNKEIKIRKKEEI